MRKFYLPKSVFLGTLAFFCANLNAQTKDDLAKISSETNRTALINSGMISIKNLREIRLKLSVMSSK